MFFNHLKKMDVDNQQNLPLLLELACCPFFFLLSNI